MLQKNNVSGLASLTGRVYLKLCTSNTERLSADGMPCIPFTCRMKEGMTPADEKDTPVFVGR